MPRVIPNDCSEHDGHWLEALVFIYSFVFGQCVATEFLSGAQVIGFTYKLRPLNV